MNKKVLLMIGCLLLASCAMHPLGIADDTWQAMTPEQQAQAYQKQADIDAKERASQQAQAAAEKQQIAEIKANSKYGQYIQCTVENTKYNDFIDGSNTTQPFSFNAINGKTLGTNITYYRNGDEFFKEHKHLYVSFDGQQIKLCNSNDEFNNKCSTLNATSKQYSKGVKLKFSGALLSGHAKCDMVYNNNHKHHRRNDNGNNIVINL